MTRKQKKIKPSLYLCVRVSLAAISVFMRPLSKHLLSLLYNVKALIYDKRGAR